MSYNINSLSCDKFTKDESQIQLAKETEQSKTVNEKKKLNQVKKKKKKKLQWEDGVSALNLRKWLINSQSSYNWI